jgi:hypothetical protein
MVSDPRSFDEITVEASREISLRSKSLLALHWAESAPVDKRTLWAGRISDVSLREIRERRVICDELEAPLRVGQGGPMGHAPPDLVASARQSREGGVRLLHDYASTLA